jgi:hypothetical protein
MMAVLTGVWPRVAGKAVAEQARPLEFSAGRLTLAVACPNWAIQLKALREEIRRALNEALGRAVVRQVRVKQVSHDDVGARAAARVEETAPISAKWIDPDLPALAQLEPQLREIVSKSYVKYFTHSDRKVN